MIFPQAFRNKIHQGPIQWNCNGNDIFQIIRSPKIQVINDDYIKKILGSRRPGVERRANICFCSGRIYFDSLKLGNCCIEERETNSLRDIILITCQV
jgi:hypothetical protein